MHTIRQSGLWTALFVVAAGHAFAVEPAAELRCAFIDLSKTEIGPLLEAKLLATAGRTWVERRELDKALGEQKLQALLSPESVRERSALGKLLKADVLILLQAAERQRETMLDLVVSESTRGVRLAAHTVPLSARPDPALLMELVERAIRKQREHPAEVWVAPSFLDQNLTKEANFLGPVFARVVEQTLLDRPGAILVELAEANRLSQELAIEGGERAARSLPYFVLGEYRHGPTVNGDRLATFTLRLERGKETLATVKKESLPPSEVAAALSGAVRDLAQRHAGGAPAPVDSAREAAQLAARAKECYTLQAWKDALDLSEASLLALPKQEEQHVRAIMSLREMIDRTYQTTDEAVRIQSLEYARRGLGHVEAFMQLDPDYGKYVATGGSHFQEQFLLSAHGYCSLPNNLQRSAELERQTAEFQKLYHDTMWRCARAILTRKPGSERMFLVPIFWDLKTNEVRLAFVSKIVWEFRDAPQCRQRTLSYLQLIYNQMDTPAGKALLDDLADRGHAEVKSGVEGLFAYRKSIDAQRREPAPLPVQGEDAYQVKTLVLICQIEGRVEKVPGIWGSVPAGAGVDVFWTRDGLYVMKEPGKLRRVWQTTERNVQIDSVSFDGKLAWATARRHRKDPLLMAVDPQRETILDFTRADGLPFVEPEQAEGEQTALVAGVGPGRAIVAGTFGRAWLAVVELNADGAKSVRVFHEAREVADGKDKEAWRKTTIVCLPSFAFTLYGADQRRYVLIGRSARHIDVAQHPLVVDAETLAVRVAEELVPGQVPRRLTVSGGALYTVASAPPKYERVYLRRLAPPEFRWENLSDGFEGLPLIHEGRTFVAGVQLWSTEPNETNLAPVVTRPPWRFDNSFSASPRGQRGALLPKDRTLDCFCYSQHHGLLLPATSNAEGRLLLAVEPIPAQAPPDTKAAPGGPRN